jgi:hypothetical protein
MWQPALLHKEGLADEVPNQSDVCIICSLCIIAYGAISVFIPSKLSSLPCLHGT